jgi:hypothetical protein
MNDNDRCNELVHWFKFRKMHIRITLAHVYIHICIDEDTCLSNIIIFFLIYYCFKMCKKIGMYVYVYMHIEYQCYVLILNN